MTDTSTPPQSNDSDWLDIPGFNGNYKINRKTEILSIKRPGNWNNLVLKQRVDNVGYKYVKLSSSLHGERPAERHYSVHRLVALMFIPNTDNLPQVNHINGDRLDNSIENLEWCSASHNIKHAFDNGLNKGHGPKLTERDAADIRMFASKGMTAKEIVKVYPVNQGTIRKILRGISWISRAQAGKAAGS